jgi:hypothetical protein
VLAGERRHWVKIRSRFRDRIDGVKALCAIACLLAVSLCRSALAAEDRIVDRSCLSNELEALTRGAFSSAKTIDGFFSKNGVVRQEQNQFLTLLAQSKVKYHQDGNNLLIDLSSSGSRAEAAVAAALAKQAPLDFTKLNLALTHEIPDPSIVKFEDWKGRGDPWGGSYASTFGGSVDELVIGELFRVSSAKDGTAIALPAYQVDKMAVEGADIFNNNNWANVGRVRGEDSRDTVSQRFPGQKVVREFYWPTSFDGSTQVTVDGYTVRVAVNSVNGVEREAEVFVRNRGIWQALFYERVDGRWVRRMTDHNGTPIPLGCVKCHGSGASFGPTPKLPKFKRPPGWMSFDSWTRKVDIETGLTSKVIQKARPSHHVHSVPDGYEFGDSEPVRWKR